MASKPETVFKKHVLSDLHKIENVWCTKIEAGAICGIPDIIGCINGRFFALELKKDAKQRPTKLQLYVLDKIKKAGGFTEIVYPENWQEIRQKLLTSASPYS